MNAAIFSAEIFSSWLNSFFNLKDSNANTPCLKSSFFSSFSTVNWFIFPNNFLADFLSSPFNPLYQSLTTTYWQASSTPLELLVSSQSFRTTARAFLTKSFNATYRSSSSKKSCRLLVVISASSSKSKKSADNSPKTYLEYNDVVPISENISSLAILPRTIITIRFRFSSSSSSLGSEQVAIHPVIQ